MSNPQFQKDPNKGRGRGRGGKGGRGAKGAALNALAPTFVPGAQENKKIVCFCLGTRHPCVTNCTLCGYILCELEVQHNHPSFASLQGTARAEAFFSCPKCDHLCTPPMDAKAIETQGCDQSTIKAYRQKDMLLQFDREHAKRTVVHDAQGDYYVSSAWLSEEERKEMELKERKRLEMKKRALRQRKINIRFDIAGRKVFEAEEEEEEEETDGAHVCKAELDELDTGSVFDGALGNEGIGMPFENSELMLSTSKAAEVYRHMRKR